MFEVMSTFDSSTTTLDWHSGTLTAINLMQLVKAAICAHHLITASSATKKKSLNDMFRYVVSSPGKFIFDSI
jgi:hypothetical protein